jgi:hypothetical protein
MITVVMWVLGFVFLSWALVPFIDMWKVAGTIGQRREMLTNMFWAMFKSIPLFIAGPLAWVVVPLALRFTPWEAEQLPWWARFWDNDVSINGDRPEYWDPAYKGTTYYYDDHPRSRAARFEWLVRRNRASRLAQMLGHWWQDGEYADIQTWGDPLVGRDHEGTVVNRRGPCWQYYQVRRLGPICLRINCGYKVWSGEGDKRRVANVVWIPFSFLSWKGA